MLQHIALTQPIPVMPASTRGASVVRLMPQAGPATACSSCCLKGVCLPCDLGRPELDRFDRVELDALLARLSDLLPRELAGTSAA
jgi:hypothetical protein